MDRFDQIIKQSLREEARDIKLSTMQKQNLKQAMINEFNNYNKKWWQRLVTKIVDFWNVTYEINMIPVAAAVATIVIAFGAFTLGNPSGDILAPNKVVYMQQTAVNPDGVLKIVYVPVEKEGSNGKHKG